MITERSQAQGQSKLMKMTSSDVQLILSTKISQLQKCQKIGNYLKLDEINLQIEKLKKQLSRVKLQQIMQIHKIGKRKLQTFNQEELEQLHNFWNQKISQFHCQKEILKKQMAQKHQQEIINNKNDLQTQLPIKIKESSECLNLRKVQEQMKKQKKYAEAHQIQLKVIEMEKKEKTAFDKQRHLKIKIALNTLKNKQNTEKQVLNKKIASGLKQLISQKQTQIQKVKLKHINSLKEINSQQQKQLLGEKRQIKSRVPLSITQPRPKFRSGSKN